MNSHLNSEQMECVLRGQPSREVEQHLSNCTQCTGELVALRELFDDLRQATAASAEHHRRFVSTAGAKRVPGLAWALAMSALLLVGAAPLAVHHRHPVRTAQVETTRGTDATISDEALLQGVQDDLSSTVPASLLPLAGTSADVTDSNNAQRKNP